MPDDVDYTYPDEAVPEYVEIADELGPVSRSSVSTTDPSRYTIPGAGTLRGDAAASYLRMRAAGMPPGGVAVFSRTYAQQAELYRRYRMGIGPIAAPPNERAPHIRGLAMDLQTTVGGLYVPSSAYVWMTKGGNGQSKPIPGESLQSHDYGWRRTVPSERWHFGYDAARDRHRAADLARRLKALGFKSVAAFQKAKGLTPDGVDGPMTWTALLSTPLPVPVPASAVSFHFVEANLQAEQWQGLDDGSPDRGRWLKKYAPASVNVLVEVPEESRNAITKIIGHKVWTVGYLCVSWNPNKWQYSKPMTVGFGTPYHGAVRVTLTDLQGSGLSMDVIGVHVRPGVSFGGTEENQVRGKLTDVRKALTLVRPDVTTIIAGDWNTKHHAELLTGAGFVRVTPEVDTSDSPGVQAIDAVWIKGNLSATNYRLVDPGKVSDHKAWDAHLKLSAPSSTA